ncbi:MAG TPA: alpha/beta hydrolase [Xanthobacteraceae bacterium]
MSAPAPKRELAPLPAAKTALVPFEVSPFPYRGEVPDKKQPFLDAVDGERRGHTSERGGTYWEEETYSDRRVLLSIPKGFDPHRPALVVVFFHGNEATLARDVRNRQQVPRQVAESGLNAALVAPQFAVDALDSSAGRFWEPGVFAQFVEEAGERLTELYGDARARGAFHAAPIVIAAYSGGYNPAAFVLHAGHVDDRLRGVVLFDALYGQVDKFADWLARRPPAFFVSSFGKAAREENTTLQRMLTERGVSFQSALPARLARGSVAFVAATDDVRHVDFMTAAWVDDPLKVVLRRIPGFARTGGASAGATPKPK